MQRRNVILGAGGLAMMGFGSWAMGSGETANETPVPETGDATATSAEETAAIDTSSIKEMVLGDENAPVEIIEYASFTCPHCAAFHQGPFKKLKAEYIDTGKVRFIYREVYFDRPGLWASMIARCAGEQKFFGVADLMYKGQSTWARAGEPAAIVEELRKIGRLAGLDNETLDGCLKDAERAETLVAWETENREADDVTSTPSFVVNGTKQANMSYAEFKKVIDAELEG